MLTKQEYNWCEVQDLWLESARKFVEKTNSDKLHNEFNSLVEDYNKRCVREYLRRFEQDRDELRRKFYSEVSANAQNWANLAKQDAQNKSGRTSGSQNKAQNQPNQVYFVQTQLIKLGYDPGIADGKFGSKTMRALRAFQRTNNLPVTGQITEETLELLRRIKL